MKSQVVHAELYLQTLILEFRNFFVNIYFSRQCSNVRLVYNFSCFRLVHMSKLYWLYKTSSLAFFLYSLEQFIC